MSISFGEFTNQVVEMTEHENLQRIAQKTFGFLLQNYSVKVDSEELDGTFEEKLKVILLNQPREISFTLKEVTVLICE